jgi:hypothetical protein
LRDRWPNVLVACLLLAAILPASVGIVIVPMPDARHVRAAGANAGRCSCQSDVCRCGSAQSCGQRCCCMMSPAPSPDAAADAAGSRADHSCRLELRSPLCSGQQQGWAFQAKAWLAEPMPQLHLDFPARDLAAIHRGIAPACLPLPVSPPPPRPGLFS